MNDLKEKLQRTISTLFSKPRSKRQAALRRSLWRKVTAGAAVVLAAILVLVLIVGGVKAVRTASLRRKQRAAEKAAAEEAEREAEANVGDASVAFTGCMILHQPILDRYRTEDGGYDFKDIYKYVKEYYEEPDLMACEMEGTISDDVHGYFGHPLFKYPAVFPYDLADTGVDLQLLATNHIYDGMADGLQITLDFYENSGLAYTGVRKDKNKERWTIVKAGTINLGIADYTYGTPESFNAIAVDQESAQLINMFSESHPESFYSEAEEQIAAMKANGADFIIYVLHWGIEYETTQSEYQTAIAQKLCDLGVDAIIGGHPHVLQPIDVLESGDGSHKMFCLYSIGNALSNQRKSNVLYSESEDGMILTLDLHKDKAGKVTFTGIELTPTWVSCHKPEENTQYDYAVLPLDKIDPLEELTGIEGVEEDARASYERTMDIVGEGLEKARKELVEE